MGWSEGRKPSREREQLPRRLRKMKKLKESQCSLKERKEDMRLEQQPKALQATVKRLNFKCKGKSLKGVEAMVVV